MEKFESAYKQSVEQHKSIPRHYKKMKRRQEENDYFDDAFFDDNVSGQRRFGKHKWCQQIAERENRRLCQFYLVYERADRGDPRSPYSLREFNFSHCHPLNLVESLP